MLLEMVKNRFSVGRLVKDGSVNDDGGFFIRRELDWFLNGFFRFVFFGAFLIILAMDSSESVLVSDDDDNIVP
jgi:hypothetical protein